MRRILLPYDFSPQARRALALALSGVPFGPEVQIDAVHVVDTHLYGKRLPGHQPPSADTLRSHFRSEIARATTPERRVKVDPILTVVTGRPGHEIMERVDGCGGIMLGGQGHGGIGETFLGTTAMRVARESPVNVYVVKKTSSLATPSRVMCAVESDDSSKRALKEAGALCKACGGSLSVMRALTLMPMFAEYPVVLPYATPQTLDEERDRLISFEIDTLKETVAKRHVVTINAGGTANDIVYQATLDRIDTIVVGAREGGVGKRLLGSVSESVVQRAACDVYVVH